MEAPFDGLLRNLILKFFTSNHKHIVNLWNTEFEAVMFRCTLTNGSKKKEKRKRDFPLDPIFLIGWGGLTVDSSKVLGTRLLTHTCPESGVVYELLWVDLMRTVSNNWLKIISLNVQTVFFNRVGHRCAEGRWEFVGKNFVGWVEQTTVLSRELTKGLMCLL